ncbi:MAG: hypothetical protein NTZ09_11840 [Candidatus Hydrogenedentes bacterium]|nr:hypothetical protein [Candidatus Hydrogenedentota bacterium]
MKLYRNALLSCLILLIAGLAAAQEQLTTPAILENPEVKLLDQEGAGKL